MNLSLLLLLLRSRVLGDVDGDPPLPPGGLGTFLLPAVGEAEGDARTSWRKSKPRGNSSSAPHSESSPCEPEPELEPLASDKARSRSFPGHIISSDAIFQAAAMLLGESGGGGGRTWSATNEDSCEPCC